MKNQDNSRANPNNYINNYNNYTSNNIHYHNNNENPNCVSSQYASNNPSPTTTPAPAPQLTTFFWNSVDSALPLTFKGFCHQRSYSDGNFQVAAGEKDRRISDTIDGVYTPSLEEMGVVEDELVSGFLNEDNGSNGQLMDHEGGSGGCNGSGGGKKKKSSRVCGRTTLPEELAELWAEDPKRVKRILANRRSAARSKERKVRHMLELERRIQSLQSDSTSLAAQIRIYERETESLSTENIGLKLRLQAMENQADLRDAINEALRREVECLKIANAELRTPTKPSPLTSRPVPYSSAASPSTLIPQPHVHFSPLPSPSTIQPPAHYTTSFTSSSTIQLPVHGTPLTSPSLVQKPYTQAASPSPSTSQTTNFLPIPKQSDYAVAPLPPLHESRSSIISRRLRQANLVTPTQQNDTTGITNRELTIVADEGVPAYSSGSGP